MTKVAVRCPNVEHLAKRQAGRVEERGGVSTVVCQTRYSPKRAEEMIGGSLYWIVKHTLAARQTILDFELVDTRQGKKCHIHLSPEVVPVLAAPLRAHQGWRYLEPGVAPPDLSTVGGDVGALPLKMMRSLRELGIL